MPLSVVRLQTTGNTQTTVDVEILESLKMLVKVTDFLAHLVDKYLLKLTQGIPYVTLQLGN